MRTSAPKHVRVAVSWRPLAPCRSLAPGRVTSLSPAISLPGPAVSWAQGAVSQARPWPCHRHTGRIAIQPMPCLLLPSHNTLQCIVTQSLPSLPLSHNTISVLRHKILTYLCSLSHNTICVLRHTYPLAIRPSQSQYNLVYCNIMAQPTNLPVAIQFSATAHPCCNTPSPSQNCTPNHHVTIQCMYCDIVPMLK